MMILEKFHNYLNILRRTMGGAEEGGEKSIILDEKKIGMNRTGGISRAMIDR